MCRVDDEMIKRRIRELPLKVLQMMSESFYQKCHPCLSERHKKFEGVANSIRELLSLCRSLWGTQDKTFVFNGPKLQFVFKRWRSQKVARGKSIIFENEAPRYSTRQFSLNFVGTKSIFEHCPHLLQFFMHSAAAIYSNLLLFFGLKNLLLWCAGG